MEFRRGILFIRLKGDLNKNTIKGVIDEDFKYVVLNLNKIRKNIEYEDGKLIICDKYNTTSRLLKDIPKISNEYDAFKLFERMI